MTEINAHLPNDPQVKHRRASPSSPRAEESMHNSIHGSMHNSDPSLNRKARRRASLRGSSHAYALAAVTVLLVSLALLQLVSNSNHPSLSITTASFSSSSSSNPTIQNNNNPNTHTSTHHRINTTNPNPHTACQDDSVDNHNKGRVWLAGIVRNASSDISPTRMQTLIDLSCRYNVSIHIVAHAGLDECLQLYQRGRQSKHNRDCAPFSVHAEPPRISKLSHRVDRIAAVRDYQREQLRVLLYNKETTIQHNNNAIVMVADLDLWSLPNLHTLMQQVKELQRPRSSSSTPSSCPTEPSPAMQPDYHAICATGIMYRPYGYYDIFATILLPDTFVYPLRGRLLPTLAPGEDLTLVRSNNLYGNWTQWDLLDYIQRQSDKLARAKEAKPPKVQLPPPVPVRSCFGGVTLYRATTWFEPRCHYSVRGNASIDLQRYASKNSQRPCEHVVFHHCLHQVSHTRTDRTVSPFSIAIQPALKTEWNSIPAKWGHLLRPASRHITLGIFRNHDQEADRLTHGEYTLRIHKSGTLRVERWKKRKNATTTGKSETQWTSRLHYAPQVDYWTHMYLLLKPNGELQLVKQVPLSLIQNRSKTLCQSKEDPCVCSESNDNCSIVVWSVNVQPINTTTLAPVLILDAHGHVSIVDEERHSKVLWTNRKE